MGKNLQGKELGVGITQRKDGIYQGRFINRFGRRETIYNKNIRALRKELAVKQAENIEKRSIKETVTVDEWFSHWISVYKKKIVRPNTLREYTHIYQKNISPHIGFYRLCDLTKSDIQNLIQIADDENYSYERQYKIRTIIKDMCQRAVEDYYLINNPVSGIVLYAKKEIHTKALTVEEQKLFFEHSQNTFYHNLFLVAVNSGLRPGELFALTKDNLDFDSSIIKVRHTLVYQKYLTDEHKTFHLEDPKTKLSTRDVPMNKVCREALMEQLKLKELVSAKRPKQQNDYLFVTKFNTPLNSQIYSSAIRSIIRGINVTRSIENEIPFFGGHTFRHTFATRCFEQGISPKIVQKYLGHASLKMTMDLYTHVTEDVSANEIEKIVDYEQVNKKNVVTFHKIS